MDKEVLRRRIEAIDIMCEINLRPTEPGSVIVSDAELSLPTRRIQELVKLARIGLEHLDG